MLQPGRVASPLQVAQNVESVRPTFAPRHGQITSRFRHFNRANTADYNKPSVRAWAFRLSTVNFGDAKSWLLGRQERSVR
jgi:hypothetical protein